MRLGIVGPGWLPGYRPRPLRRPTLAYTRALRRSRLRTNKQAKPSTPVNNEIVLFDYPPTEFPVATARPRHLRAQTIAVLAALQQWVRERWTWLRPRAVPCA